MFSFALGGLSCLVGAYVLHDPFLLVAGVAMALTAMALDVIRIQRERG